MNRNFDFLVVGGGIAGVAVGSELARHGSVLLIDRESSLSYHTTGRSAAISMESYGNALIRRLTCASRDFFEKPPSFSYRWAMAASLVRSTRAAMS